MASLLTSKLLYSGVSVLFGTAGSTANTPFGYIYRDGNVVLKAVLNAEPIEVHGEDLAVGIFSGAKALSVLIPLAQLGDFSVLDKALGYDAGGGETITFGDPTQSRLLPIMSIAFIGADVNGDTWRVDFLHASVNTDAEVTLGPQQRSQAAVEFLALGLDSEYPTIKHASGDTPATLSTGELTITAGYHKIKGEGDAADVWDSFTGLSESDDESIYRFQAYTSDYTITVTHGIGVIVLIDETNFVMGGASGSLKDYIDFQYDHENTLLTEIGRHDEPG